jgi:crossover junction endodeoxyribonuclease RuvC
MPQDHDSEIVIGIDPGTGITGYGIIAQTNANPLLVEAGVIRSDSGDLPEKLNSIHEELKRIITEFRPTRMAVEELYAHYRHPRTSITMAHARGVILLAAAESGLEITSYPATEIKKTITGNGRASKEHVRGMVSHILSLESEPDYLDITDALAAALTDFMHRKNFEFTKKVIMRNR